MNGAVTFADSARPRSFRAGHRDRRALTPPKMIPRIMRRGLATGPYKHIDDRSMSLLAAVADAEARRWRMLARGGALLAVYWAYDYATRMYAYMMLGSSATEQLFMQRLEGTVELQLSMRPFSSVGEVRGLLTPVREAPHTSGPMNHRAFTLLTPPSVSHDSVGHTPKTKARHAAAAELQLPPVVTKRDVSIFRPMHLSALLWPQETHLYCRKSKAGTEYFSVAPPNWRGAAILSG